MLAQVRAYAESVALHSDAEEIAEEVLLAMSLNHEFVCRTLGTAVAVGVDGNSEMPCPALVMELVEGGTLEQLLRYTMAHIQH